MFEKRLRSYRAIGYARDEPALGHTESQHERFIDYDDALPMFDHESATDPGRRRGGMGRAVKQRSKKSGAKKPALGSAKLRSMIEEATVDAYDESEQMLGWFTMLENHLELPFDTEVLGVRVRVERIDLRHDRIVAVCRCGSIRQVIDLTDLPLPTPVPAGAEWIEALRQWREGW